MESFDPEAVTKMVQGLDQVTEFLKAYGAVLAPYLKEMQRQGFTRDEAMELTLELQRRLFDQAGLGVRHAN